MADPIVDNPFTKVYNALWRIVKVHPGIDRAVKLGNRITFGEDNRDPWKDKVSASDVPELVLVQDATQIRVNNTSSTSMCVREYSWLISTGDFRVNHYLNEVEWLLFTAHTGWQAVMKCLLYNDRTFVKRVDFIGTTTGFTDSDSNRGLRGWSSIWRVQVEMHFSTADLQGEL